jgi:CheY-like chemotaxis protein
VRLLFTDVNMPGTIDGLALARQARDRWPHIGIIVVSGQLMLKPHELPAGGRFHRKPYDPDSVVRHARDLTAARGVRRRPPIARASEKTAASSR